MARATIIIDRESPDEIKAAADWFAAWSDRLSYRSEDYGCGCCVNVYDVEAPEEAVAALPLSIRGASDWVSKDTRG